MIFHVLAMDDVALVDSHAHFANERLHVNVMFGSVPPEIK
jgi:hypothetical protein